MALEPFKGSGAFFCDATRGGSEVRMAATCANRANTIQKGPLNSVPSCERSGENSMPGKNAELSATCTWARTTMALVMLLLRASLFASRPALAAPPSSYDDAIKQVSSQLADAIASSGKKAVAVSAFTDLDGNVTEIGRFLAGDLSASLAAQAKGFMVIDRTQSKGSPQAPGVDALVIGSITAFSDHVRLSTKLLDASNSAILGAATADIPRTKDIDDLLAGSAPAAPAMKSGNSRAAASSSAPSSAAAANTATTATAAASPAPSGKAPRGSSKPAKTPSSAGAPSASGIGSVATDAYRVIATSVDRSGGNATVTLEFDAVGENTVLLAMLPNQTYLTDETNVRWALTRPDTAKIFNVRGGFWHGIPLAKGAKIQTVLTFAPQGPATGKKFTLTISEFRPKWNRVVAIQGLQ
jgi:TolB-like protein